jgi:hypothetical protein
MQQCACVANVTKTRANRSLPGSRVPEYAGQAVHAALPVVEYLPAAHIVQTEEAVASA